MVPTLKCTTPFTPMEVCKNCAITFLLYNLVRGKTFCNPTASKIVLFFVRLCNFSWTERDERLHRTFPTTAARHYK